MTDHNIVAAFIPLVERPPQALADNAAHENADLFAQDQICVSRHFILKKFYLVGQVSAAKKREGRTRDKGSLLPKTRTTYS